VPTPPPAAAEPQSPIAAHGAAVLPSVVVDTYNTEARDGEGFIGDRASKGAFQDILERLRKPLREVDSDPLGDAPTEEISRKKLEKILASDDLEAVGLIQGAIEEFSQELATVIRRFLKHKAWQDTERIVVGGGFKESRIGELVIGRTAVLVKSEGFAIDLRPIEHHPDEAALIGGAHLAPAWIFAGHTGIVGVDIGGTNIRAGLVELHLKSAPDLSKSQVVKSELWRHADDEPKREQAVERLAEMIAGLIRHAGREKFRLAPFIGIGCPGVIAEDGSIERGAQNLPGNWESSKFNLPARLREAIPEIDGHPTTVVMHNDAVLQGLSETPRMQDVTHWGVLTIGTGLGNARFTNRVEEKRKG
jgi:predicted NBD/HSP70 family sugar kinase